MQLAVTDYMAGGQRPAKSYLVKNGIAILPVSGTLVHKLGTLRPYSGMTGYDGLTARLQMAVNDRMCAAFCWISTARAVRLPGRLTVLT